MLVRSFPVKELRASKLETTAGENSCGTTLYDHNLSGQLFVGADQTISMFCKPAGLPLPEAPLAAKSASKIRKRMKTKHFTDKLVYLASLNFAESDSG